MLLKFGTVQVRDISLCFNFSAAITASHYNKQTHPFNFHGNSATVAQWWLARGLQGSHVCCWNCFVLFSRGWGTLTLARVVL